MFDKKLILVDCDGVLLDWTKQFEKWMFNQGYYKNKIVNSEYYSELFFNVTYSESRELTRIFNESAWILGLEPIRDSVEIVRKLNEEHDYQFLVITAFGTDPYSKILRKQNLDEVFGKDIFVDVIATPMNGNIAESKREALEEYRDSGLFWIEDRYENAVVGANLGLKSLLIDHHHNAHYKLPSSIKRVYTWADIYRIITSD